MQARHAYREATRFDSTGRQSADGVRRALTRGRTMYEGSTIGVVVPAYNESDLVGRTIDRIPDYVDRVYVVDDASTDDTWDVITDAAQRRNSEDGTGRFAPDGGTNIDAEPTSNASVGSDRTVVPIRHEHNRGVGGAIKTGYRRALRDGLDIVAVMAGDNQMDPEYLPRLLDPIVADEVDYAKGNRLLYPDHRQAMSRWRLFGNSLLSLLTKIASGYWKTMDPQNGYTAISRTALEAVDLDSLYEDYGFSNALLVRLNAHDMRVADVAMPAVYGEEESHIEYRSFVPNLSGVLLSGFCWRLRRKYLMLDFHPLAFLYGLGATASGLSVVLGLWTVWALLSGSAAMTGAVGTALLFSVGVYALVQAMRDDMTENEDLEVQVT